jgi:hypothetical protein
MFADDVNKQFDRITTEKNVHSISDQSSRISSNSGAGSD